ATRGHRGSAGRLRLYERSPVGFANRSPDTGGGSGSGRGESGTRRPRRLGPAFLLIPSFLPQGAGMSDGASSLVIEAAGGVVRLTLNRPQCRNALSRALLSELETALARIAADTATRVVIVAGAGEAFCAGHDLTEMLGRSEAEYRDLFGA